MKIFTKASQQKNFDAAVVDYHQGKYGQAIAAFRDFISVQEDRIERGKNSSSDLATARGLLAESQSLWQRQKLARRTQTLIEPKRPSRPASPNAQAALRDAPPMPTAGPSRMIEGLEAFSTLSVSVSADDWHDDGASSTAVDRDSYLSIESESSFGTPYPLYRPASHPPTPVTPVLRAYEDDLDAILSNYTDGHAGPLELSPLPNRVSASAFTPASANQQDLPLSVGASPNDGGVQVGRGNYAGQALRFSLLAGPDISSPNPQTGDRDFDVQPASRPRAMLLPAFDTLVTDSASPQEAGTPRRGSFASSSPASSHSSYNPQIVRVTASPFLTAPRVGARTPRI